MTIPKVLNILDAQEKLPGRQRRELKLGLRNGGLLGFNGDVMNHQQMVI